MTKYEKIMGAITGKEILEVDVRPYHTTIIFTDDTQINMWQDDNGERCIDTRNWDVDYSPVREEIYVLNEVSDRVLTIGASKYESLKLGATYQRLVSIVKANCVEELKGLGLDETIFVVGW